jgi:hypothetical protein
MVLGVMDYFDAGMDRKKMATLKGTKRLVRKVVVPSRGVHMSMDLDGTNALVEYYGGCWIVFDNGDQQFCGSLRMLVGPAHFDVEAL